MATKGKRSIFIDGCTLPDQAGEATAAIRPGALVVFAAAGAGVTESAEAATVFGSQALFADYNMYEAKTVDDSWATGEQAIVRQLESGARANVLVAAGQNITKRGVALASNGDGTLVIAATDGTEEVKCYSDEIINTGGAAALVRVRGA